MTETTSRSELIAAANDQFRKTARADIYFAGELAKEGMLNQIVALARVRQFKAEEFNEDNDPYGEHDFLSFNFGERKVFAKFDYLDQNLEWGLDPLDPNCRRVLTIFYAEDY